RRAEEGVGIGQSQGAGARLDEVDVRPRGAQEARVAGIGQWGISAAVDAGGAAEEVAEALGAGPAILGNRSGAAAAVGESDVDVVPAGWQRDRAGGRRVPHGVVEDLVAVDAKQSAIVDVFREGDGAGVVAVVVGEVDLATVEPG